MITRRKLLSMIPLIPFTPVLASRGRAESESPFPLRPRNADEWRMAFAAEKAYRTLREYVAQDHNYVIDPSEFVCRNLYGLVVATERGHNTWTVRATITSGPMVWHQGVRKPLDDVRVPFEDFQRACSMLSIWLWEKAWRDVGYSVDTHETREEMYARIPDMRREDRARAFSVNHHRG